MYLQPADAGAALRSGSVDAWSIWAPFYALSEHEPGVHVLTNAEGVAPSNAFFLATRSFATKNPAVVAAIIAETTAAWHWAQGHQSELAAVLSEASGIPVDVERVVAARGNYEIAYITPQVVRRQQTIADTFSGLGLMAACDPNCSSRLDTHRRRARGQIQRNGNTMTTVDNPARPRTQLALRRLTPALGAVIENVDLAQELHAGTIAAIRAALDEHLVLFFEGQSWTPEQQRDFAGRFGELYVHPLYPGQPGLPEIMLLEYDADRRGHNDVWHSDVTYIQTPPQASILYWEIVPELGGDTL